MASFSLRMGQFSNPVATHPRTNEVEVPPLDVSFISCHVCCLRHFLESIQLDFNSCILPVTDEIFAYKNVQTKFIDPPNPPVVKKYKSEAEFIMSNKFRCYVQINSVAKPNFK